MAGESVAQGWRIVRRGFRGAYDYMGMNMVVSALWFFIGLAPTGLALLVALQAPSVLSAVVFGLVCTFLLGPVTAATYSMTTAMVRGDYVIVRDFFKRFVEHYKGGASVTAALVIVLAILLVDLFFFLTSESPLMRFLGIFWVYFLVFWALAVQYAYPLLVRRKPRAIETLKMAALLALDNVVASLILAVAGLFVAAASIFFQVPIVLFFAGTLGFLHAAALDELLKKYRRSDEEPEGQSEGEASE